MDNPEPILSVSFFKTQTIREPVREWLKSLPREQRRIIGEDIKTVQFGWPLGMPLVRIRLPDGIARVLFTAGEGRMILLHGFIKKSHIGSDFDSFLQQDGLLAECEAGALLRVVTWQITQEMKRRRISRAKLASRMKTSRSTFDRLFAEEETPVTLQILERAALALGRKLKVELA